MARRLRPSDPGNGELSHTSGRMGGATLERRSHPAALCNARRRRTWRRRVLTPPSGWSGARIFPDIPVFFGSRGVLPAMLARGGSSAVAFYGTSDGGRTWRAQAVRRVAFRIVVGHPWDVRYVPVSVASPDIWWVVAGRTKPLVSITVDGGRAWRTYPPSSLPRSRWWTISAASPTRAWLSVYSSARSELLETRDSGRSWRQLSPR
jgi:hypothetical protein